MLEDHLIFGAHSVAYPINQSGDMWTLGKNASITSSALSALYEEDGIFGSHVVINGTITGAMVHPSSAIELVGAASQVEVEKSGHLAAYTGIDLKGGGEKAINHGHIDAAGVGIWAHSDATIRNDGVINSDGQAILSVLGAVSVTNGAGGRMVSNLETIYFQGDPSVASHLYNYGLIKSTGGDAVHSTFGGDIIRNRGVMIGAISLGAGDDSFDNRGGSVDHVISGGSGDDTLLTDNAKTRLDESDGEGTDTVKSTVSYTLHANVENLVLLGKTDNVGRGNDEDNTIKGNAGDNRLYGGAGIDTLKGMAGNDILEGGGDADIFLFGKHGGHDVIRDFVSGVDHIDLSELGAVIDYNDMKANHVTVSDGNLTIHAGQDSLTILHFTKADLDFNDFYF